MDKHADTVENLKMWQNQWQDAQRKFAPSKPVNVDCIIERLTPPSPSPAPAVQTSDKPLDWDEMVRLSQNIDRFFKVETVNAPQDVTKFQTGEFMVNPVHFSSLGKDQDVRVTPNFSDGPVLRELNSLKLALHALEDKFNTAYAVGTDKEEESLKKEIESVRLKIEDLSNRLAPHPINDPS